VVLPLVYLDCIFCSHELLCEAFDFKVGRFGFFLGSCKAALKVTDLVLKLFRMLGMACLKGREYGYSQDHTKQISVSQKVLSKSEKKSQAIAR
jgi:hypothetical protein